MSITTLAIIIFILILLSGIFSGSETALTASSSAKIHQLKKEGSRRAVLVEKLRDQKEKLIGAILFGNNVVNILASALATSLAISVWGNEGVAIATLIMTMLVLVFAEVLPKTYAFHNAEKMSLFVAPLIYGFVKISYPITILIEWIVAGVMTILGLKKKSQEIISGVDELRGAIDLHHAKGQVVKKDRDMLASILDLERVEVEHVMVHRKNIVSINIDLPVRDIVSQVLDSPYTRIPLWKDKPENIVGLLHAKALLLALRSHSGDIEDLSIQRIATKPWFVPGTNTIGRQLLQFRQRKLHQAIVISEYGDLVGLITLEDILEEIVGEIEDEHDIEFYDIVTNDDGSVDMSGQANIRDLNRQFNWELPDDITATIAGLLMHELEDIPNQGDTGEVAGMRFTVLHKVNQQIVRVRLEKL